MNVQQPSPISSCQNSQNQSHMMQQQQQQQEMHNMGYSSLTPQSHHSGYNHVHSNQSCPPGSVENLESPHSIQSCSSVDTNHPHGGPGSVESYHQMHQHQQIYDSCKYGPVHSPMPMTINPPTPHTPMNMHHSGNPSPQHSESPVSYIFCYR